MASPEVVIQRCSVKKLLLKRTQNSQENTSAEVSFERPTTLLKRDSNTRVFL